MQTCPSCNSENDLGEEVCFKCGRGLSGITEGSVLGGRYKIQSRLGRGGMGVVYRAQDSELDEVVAIKVLRSDVSSPDLSRRFRSEIKLARRVTHRNVCRIHEFGREGNVAYIVMEFVNGVDFRRILRERGRLAVAEAYDVAIQIADGLQEIHDAGIVHRDLKTANIMRDSRGAVKLMDFGIAKSAEASESQATATGQVLGTPEYMSPEQARAEKIDARSDVYALGIVTYELFVGEVPFRSETPISTLMRHINEAPSLDNKGLPEALVPVLGRALAKQPNERYSTARDFACALRAARGGPGDTPTKLITAPTSSEQLTAPLGPAPATTVVATARPGPTRLASAMETPAAPRPARPQPTPSAPGAPRARPARPAASRGMRAALWGVPILIAAAAGIVALRYALAPRTDEQAEAAAVNANPAAHSTPPHGRVVPPPTAAPSRAITPVATVAAAAREAPPAATPAPAPSARSYPAASANQPARRAETLALRPLATPTPATVAAVASRRTESTLAPVLASTPAQAAAHVSPPSATPQATPALGMLKIIVSPWADVEVDGAKAGMSPPLGPLSLSEGAHAVTLSHPDYQPFRRKVTVRAGETTRFQVDLAKEAFPKAK